MTFLELYGAALDTELASSDRTQLFTTARRKKAVNDAVKNFVRQTGCTKIYGSISIVDNTGEYDLFAAFSDYRRIAEPPSVKIVSGSNTRYIQGPNDFPRRSPAELDRLDPGWKSASKGTPTSWYLKDDSGKQLLGMTPPPEVGADTWTFVVPYVADPTDMSADADLPFTIGGLVLPHLRHYHQALAHYAAALLEPLRKNYSGVQRQTQMYTGYVAQFFQQGSEDGQDQITMMRDYFGEGVRAVRAVDPRR